MKIGVINDLHGPFEDPKAVSLVLDVLEDVGVDQVILNGDVLDFYGLNSYSKGSPLVIEHLQDEFDWGVEFLENLTKRFDNIVYLFGNHEHRLDRYVVQNCKSFHNFLKLDKMLRLKEFGIEWHPYNTAYQIGKHNLYVQHSPPSYSDNLCNASLKKKPGASFIYGCSHRLDFACKTLVGGGLTSVYSNGWLGSTTLSSSHKEVFSYAKGHSNWQQGFCIITTDKDDFFVNQFIIKNHKVSVEGHIYEF